VNTHSSVLLVFHERSPTLADQRIQQWLFGLQRYMKGSWQRNKNVVRFFWRGQSLYIFFWHMYNNINNQCILLKFTTALLMIFQLSLHPGGIRTRTVCSSWARAGKLLFVEQMIILYVRNIKLFFLWNVFYKNSNCVASQFLLNKS
jgi:hypothetical protein